ncbi:MAG: hypothetical protein KIT58_08920 [Planctomycetota bacterium]|nr:hypothetical protein [Planctomycetota bacterium]
MTSLCRWTRPGALVATLALLAAGRAEAQSTRPEPYFSPRGGGAEATARLIDAAQETIDVAMYSVTTTSASPIHVALERAVQRGVRVRFILNQATSANKSKANALKNIGVHVYGVSRTLHEKFAIVDARTSRRRLVNGSANWSTGAEQKYSENTVVFGNHYHLVHQFQEEFNRLMAAARPYTPEAAEHMAPVVLSPPSPFVRRYESALFSSMNHGNGTAIIADKIIEVMRSAERSILVDVAHFNCVSIAKALVDLRRTKPHLRIEVLTDLGSFSDTKSRARDLERAGIEVRYKVYSLVWLHPRSQLMHHKTLIVDERHIVTGSYNWSETAESSNYENVTVIDGSVSRNRACAAAYVAEHDKLWNLGRDIFPRFRAAMLAQPSSPGFKPIIPVHFDTPYFDSIMTLTRNEFAPVRAVAFSAGILERAPDGSTIYHNAVTYLDRVAGGPHRGPNPTGRFLDPVPSNTSGLSGSLPGQ